MSVATSTAIGIGLAASAGSSLAAAKIQSNAAKNAAKVQQAATDKAIGVQQQANQPYMDLGRQAVGRLSQMAPQPYTQTFGSGSNGAQAFQPPGGTLAGLGQPQWPQIPPQAMGAPQGPQGGMVRLQAPDGSVSNVPEAMAPQFLAKGARRIS